MSIFCLYELTHPYNDDYEIDAVIKVYEWHFVSMYRYHRIEKNKKEALLNYVKKINKCYFFGKKTIMAKKKKEKTFITFIHFLLTNSIISFLLSILFVKVRKNMK